MQTQVLKINKLSPGNDSINHAIDVLMSGGLVAFPTETVYGLAANADSKDALEKLSKVKNRPGNKPVALLISVLDDIDRFAVKVLPAAYRLADKFWPGPLTMVLEAKGSEIGAVAVLDSSVGLRMPETVVALELCKRADFSIACSSANLSGQEAPLDAKGVLKQLGGRIELVLDAGKVELGVPSTVVDARQLPFVVLREGFIKPDVIEQFSRKKRVLFVCTGNSCRSVAAEGLFRKNLRDKNRIDVEVISAGTAAFRGLGASSEMQELLRQEGIDASGHESQPVTDMLLKRCDLVLTMQRHHEQMVKSMYPSLSDRVYLLKEFSGFKQDSLEIKDPMGGGIDVYRKSFAEIKEAVSRLVELV